MLLAEIGVGVFVFVRRDEVGIYTRSYGIVLIITSYMDTIASYLQPSLTFSS